MTKPPNKDLQLPNPRYEQERGFAAEVRRWTDQRESRSSAALLLAAAPLLLLSGCLAGAELPPVDGPAVAVEVCGFAPPPPLEPVERGSDVAVCLSECERGFQLVLVQVSATGRAAHIESVTTFRDRPRKNDTEQADCKLGAGAETCLLGQLRDWRFMSFSTCQRSLAQFEVEAVGATGPMLSNRGHS